MAKAAQEELAAKVALWAHLVAVASIKTLVPITLDLQAANYCHWRGLFEVALCKYALDNHIKPAASTVIEATSSLDPSGHASTLSSAPGFMVPSPLIFFPW